MASHINCLCPFFKACSSEFCGCMPIEHSGSQIQWHRSRAQVNHFLSQQSTVRGNWGFATVIRTVVSSQSVKEKNDHHLWVVQWHYCTALAVIIYTGWLLWYHFVSAANHCLWSPPQWYNVYNVTKPVQPVSVPNHHHASPHVTIRPHSHVRYSLKSDQCSNHSSECIWQVVMKRCIGNALWVIRPRKTTGGIIPATAVN